MRNSYGYDIGIIITRLQLSIICMRAQDISDSRKRNEYVMNDSLLLVHIIPMSLNSLCEKCDFTSYIQTMNRKM